MKHKDTKALRLCVFVFHSKSMKETILKGEFRSWRQALAEDHLTAEQLAVLKTMVEDGEADNVEAAAAKLDWQDTVINPEEHMYGF